MCLLSPKVDVQTSQDQPENTLVIGDDRCRRLLRCALTRIVHITSLDACNSFKGSTRCVVRRALAPSQGLRPCRKSVQLGESRYYIIVRQGPSTYIFLHWLFFLWLSSCKYHILYTMCVPCFILMNHTYALNGVLLLGIVKTVVKERAIAVRSQWSYMSKCILHFVFSMALMNWVQIRYRMASRLQSNTERSHVDTMCYKKIETYNRIYFKILAPGQSRNVNCEYREAKEKEKIKEENNSKERILGFHVWAKRMMWEPNSRVRFNLGISTSKGVWCWTVWVWWWAVFYDRKCRMADTPSLF